MLSADIKFINFKQKSNKKKVHKNLKIILNDKNEVLNSLGKFYKNSFNQKQLKKFSKTSNFRIIGMGGSSLGAKAIHDFLKHKIKKHFEFIDNLRPKSKRSKKKITNVIVSKSGNTTETIVNSNILIKKNDQNIFITEKNESYLYILAKKLKSEIIHHNNYIGGRYSVLSEVGMVPAELMGLKSHNFKRFNSLIKNKNFVKNLITNVSSILYFNKKKNLIL